MDEDHGTGQLIKNCQRILNGNFFADIDIPSDCKIYPLLITDDFGFSSDGFNRYVIERTKNFDENNSMHVMPFTVLDMDTLILVSELIRNNRFDIFENIEKYHQYIEGKEKTYTMNELFHYSEVSFTSYIYSEYETCSPKIIDEWYESL